MRRWPMRSRRRREKGAGWPVSDPSSGRRLHTNACATLYPATFDNDPVMRPPQPGGFLLLPYLPTQILEFESHHSLTHSGPGQQYTRPSMNNPWKGTRSWTHHAITNEELPCKQRAEYITMVLIRGFREATHSKIRSPRSRSGPRSCPRRWR